MTRVIPDDAADRAAAADPRFNVTLEASAGTGKTRVLVTRYIRLVEEGADPRHILAITFTRKAAGEMKSRIIAELRDRGSLWKEIRERLFEIHVATIDAFCLGLLREFPLEAGLDPDVDLLDEVDIEQLAEEAVDKALSGPLPKQGPDLAFLISVFGEGAVRRGSRDFLRSRLVKDEVLTRFVQQVVPRDIRLDEALKNAAAGLEDALGGTEAMQELLSCGPGPSRPEWNGLRFALDRAVSPHLASAQDIEQTADYFLTREGKPRKRLASLFTRSDFPNRADYEKHRDLVLARAPDVAEVYRRWSGARDRHAVRELWKLFQRVLRRFNDLKESRHGLDFTDVLLNAVELLRRQGDFSQSRYRLESRYHHLLIDEFQDTNAAQWSLVHELIRSWGEGAGLVQEIILAEQAAGRGRGLLREPSIFIVGDRKQSIYGWRDARVEVMETAARKITRLRPGGGRRLHIRRSFRARSDLLAFLNDVFSTMPEAKEKLPWTFRYREIDHFPVPDERQGECPVGLAIAPDHPQAAAAVADEIVRLLNEGSYRPRDIAILFRSRTHYRAYEEALAERGVPTYVYRGLGFFDSAEVRDVQALARYLAEPGSDLRAAELARSRFIMLSDTGLALIAQTRNKRAREGPLAKLLRGVKSVDPLLPLVSAEDRAALGRAAEAVPRWLDKADRLPPTELLQQILDETDYPAWFADPREARQGWENLKKVLEMVRRAQNRGYMTLSRLADYLERASSGEESLAVLEAVDAVNLMTIHAAKGLEFDAVFVVNLDQKTRRDTSLPRITEKTSGEEETAEVHALDRPEREGPDRTVEEEKRLLYVALTRARKNLVLSACRTSESEGEATLLQLLPASLREVIDAALNTTGFVSSSPAASLSATTKSRNPPISAWRSKRFPTNRHPGCP